MVQASTEIADGKPAYYYQENGVRL